MADEEPFSPLPADTFMPPSIHHAALRSGASFTHLSSIPASLLPSDPSDPSSAPPCCLGVDEAGRGPVLGPMVYGVFFLPLDKSDPLLKEAHHFDDSKVLTAAVRSQLMEALCTPGTDLFEACGWSTTCLSARDIGAHMMRPNPYNLNAQAHDTTIDLIKSIMAAGVNVAEIYVDTVGPPVTYQAKLQRLFPTAKVTVAKKADSLYACVSAASVCAKVTRDAALEALYAARRRTDGDPWTEGDMSWGCGYPSDSKTSTWLRQNMHPVFGWGMECRFSWGTAKDMLEAKGAGVKVEWPEPEEDEAHRLTDYFSGEQEKEDELTTWFGKPAGLEAF